ncbi:MAG: hypothetical protein AAFU03_11760, partial [Bacteroidota bacterium]
MSILIVLLLASIASTLGAQCTEEDSGLLTVTPPLPSGGYAPGTVVSMCFELNEFQTPLTNWLHSIIPEFGVGFDVSTFTPISLPAACNTNGTWGYYTSWTGCNSGLTFGPGFTYDGDGGLGCGGTDFDGDPGNNYGDGPTFCPRTWCWEITTTTGGTGCEAEDFRTQVFVYGDAESGSWNQPQPCIADPPLCWPTIENFGASVNTVCAPGCFTLTGTFDAEVTCGLNILWTGPNGFTSTDLVATACEEGQYTLSISLDGCQDFDETVTAMWTNVAPTLQPGPTVNACFGETITLTATGGGTYTFMDPSGFPVASSTSPTYTFVADNNSAGVWTVEVTNSGCSGTAVTEIIVSPELFPMATADP